VARCATKPRCFSSSFYDDIAPPPTNTTYPSLLLPLQVDLTIGSALDIFGGELPYREIVEWNKRNEYL